MNLNRRIRKMWDEHPDNLFSSKVPPGTTTEDLQRVMQALAKKDAAPKREEWVCPYCGDPLPDERAAHCEEVGHAERVEVDDESSD